jgi:hypothetical protein
MLRRPSAAAQDMLSSEVEDQGWTAERFRDAEPMELPRLDAELGDRENFEPLRDGGKRFAMRGHDAPAPIPPGKTRLFDVEDDEDEPSSAFEPQGGEVEPFDIGTERAPFSSSRLIPSMPGCFIRIARPDGCSGARPSVTSGARPP